MSEPTKTYNPFDVVVVPFPFTDSATQKRRPALILSQTVAFNAPSGHSVMAMITSADNTPWPLDVRLANLASAGLPVPSVVRMKLFTLDLRLILAGIGTLDQADQGAVRQSLSGLFGFDVNRVA